MSDPLNRYMGRPRRLARLRANSKITKRSQLAFASIGVHSWFIEKLPNEPIQSDSGVFYTFQHGCRWGLVELFLPVFAKRTQPSGSQISGLRFRLATDSAAQAAAPGSESRNYQTKPFARRAGSRFPVQGSKPSELRNEPI